MLLIIINNIIMSINAGIVCGNLTAPENGNVTFDEFIGWGGSATYSCDEGYTLTGTSTRECQKSATWTSTAPTCESKCFRLASSINCIDAEAI